MPIIFEFIYKLFLLVLVRMTVGEGKLWFTFTFLNTSHFPPSVNSLLCRFKWTVFRGDTALHSENDCWQFTDINCAGNGCGGEKRLIMNTFPLIHAAKIFYLQLISLGLYIQLMRFQINVEWTAFKLLFSLDALYWKRQGYHQMTEKLLLIYSLYKAGLENAK